MMCVMKEIVNRPFLKRKRLVLIYFLLEKEDHSLSTNIYLNYNLIKASGIGEKIEIVKPRRWGGGVKI